jgi:hypothetical protein
MSRFAAIARSRLARILAVSAGFVLVAISIDRTGIDRVEDALRRAAILVPIAIALEAGIVACDMTALRMLYGDARRRIPLRAWVRAGLCGYPVMCLVPMGRAVAEAARAAMLSRWSDGISAAAAAARLQGVLLLANGAISFACMAGALARRPPAIIPLAIAANAIAMIALGSLVLFAGARSRIGALLARITSRAAHFGPKLDARLKEDPRSSRSAIVPAIAARVVQVAQCAILVAAVGGKLGLVEGLSAEGISLVGATAGDLIPGQLGATEATFMWTSDLLSLGGSEAVSIALILHLVQGFWVVVGLVASLVWVER